MNEQKLIKLCSDVEVIKSRLESFIQYINEDVNEKSDDHEKRIRFLEKYAWLLIGGIGLITVLINLFIK